MVLNMRIGFVAEQVGGSTMQELYAKTFEQAGHECVRIGHEQIALRDRVEELFGCAVVWVDASYAKDCQRMMAIAEELKTQSVPRVLIEGVPGQYVNEHTGKSIANSNPRLLDHIFSCTSASHDATIAAGASASFPGYPLHWRGSLEDLRAGKRMKADLPIERHGGTETDVVGDRVMIYLPGFKIRANEDRIIGDILGAADRLAVTDKRYARENLVFPIRPHPGERNPAMHTFEQIAASNEWRARELDSVWKLQGGLPGAPQQKLSNAHIVGAADVPVFVGGPTESLTAMIERKLCVHVLDGYPEYDARTWEPVRIGGLVTTTMDDVRDTLLATLTSEEKYEEIRENQERHYPVPERWDTVDVILKELVKRYEKR
jgi:hypothetical protein